MIVEQIVQNETDVRVIEWNLTEKNFKRAILNVRKQKEESNDVVGSLHIGYLSFDLILRDYEDGEGIVLSTDLYIGDMNTGYSQTLTNNYPYDQDGGFNVLTRNTLDKYKSLDDFKQGFEKEAIDYILEENNSEYIKRLNMPTLFNWE